MAEVLPTIEVTASLDGDQGTPDPPEVLSSPVEEKGADALANPSRSLNGEGPPSKRQPESTNNENSVSPARKSSIDGRDQGHQSQTAIDPLSRHILKRTNTENIIPQKLRTATSDSMGEVLGATGPAGADVAIGGRKSTSVSPHAENLLNPKDKKKGVSFLSRIMRNKKIETPSEIDDDDSEAGDRRIEGMDAAVFSQPVGFIPQFPPPPKYIKVRARNKKTRDFNRVFLAQELQSRKAQEKSANGLETKVEEPRPGIKESQTAVWALEFSKDGKYLATGGQDKVVRVWAVISTSEEREAHEMDEEVHIAYTDNAGTKERFEKLQAPVFRSTTVREYEGHTADVLDISWSKNNFLLSSSMDKTVRLWHISRAECLCAFKHSDFVTSIAFHPRDDRFFLAGSLDSKLRLWSIPDKQVAFFSTLPDLITAVSFTPDGKTAIAGCLKGLCLFYETEGLKYLTQIHVRSSHGRNVKGSKITGIETITYPPDDPSGEVKLLITSNDSRIRLYNFRDKSLELKFKGNENTCSQIHASFSDDARWVISGSEDRKCYIWSTGPGEDDKRDRRPMEMFEAHKAIVTTARLAPTQTKKLLSSSGDPLFDLCNPPRITLTSRNDSKTSSRPPTLSEKRDSEAGSTTSPDHPASIDTNPTAATGPTSAPLAQSATWTARSGHLDGNIIVTADYTGAIKVFRQDCAWQKRLRSESWDASSFSKRVGTGLFNRSASIATRTSASSSVHRNSSSALNLNLGLARGSDDRINSWRNSVGSSKDSLDSLAFRGTPGRERANRSVSPRKAVGTRGLLQKGAPPAFPIPSIETSPPPPGSDEQPSADEAMAGAPLESSRSNPPQRFFPGMDRDDPLMIAPNGQSMMYYNTSSWKMGGPRRESVDPSAEMDAEGEGVAQGGAHMGRGGREEDGSGHLMRPRTLKRGDSSVSRLSSDSSYGGEDDEGEKEGASKDADVREKCTKCGATSWAWETGLRGRKEVCRRCGRERGK